MFNLVFLRIFAFLRIVFLMACTFVRDVRGIRLLIKVKKYLKSIEDQKLSVPDIFETWYHKQPNKPCIVFNDKTWTFKDMEIYANKMANVFADKYNLKKGDSICLFMENKPEYVGIWLGLSKLGVISALLNTNLRAASLIHCIKVAKPKILIYGEEQEQQVLEIRDSLERDIKIDFVRQGNSILTPEESQRTVQLEALLKPSSDVFQKKEPVYGTDILMYIYTSGTTGLPKPAIIKHNRYIAGGYTFFTSCSLSSDEVFFVTLPIYHSNAGCIGIGSALISGCTVVLKKKFSASTFWKDCIQYNCTAFSYVGEVCRYLLNQPPSEYDKKHKVRVCVGNGLRSNIHKEFSERFNIKAVEVYGATEGNCTLVNIDGKYGACGFIPILGRYINLSPIYSIKVDNKMNPVRDAQGRCILCDPNEKGLLIGLIGKDTRTSYSGYANSDGSTNSKIITDVFKKGQRAFNTGDMVMIDDYGWVYFVDRLGDTFRWRGENVSTVEVENVVSSKLNAIETVVYGVEIPGQEGRAGMAVIMRKNVDILKLGEDLKKDLPAYARPIFIRLNEQVEHTGSFKAQKQKLMEEAFDVNKFNDKTYYFDLKEQNYKELTPEIYDQIVKGKMKV